MRADLASAAKAREVIAVQPTAAAEFILDEPAAIGGPRIMWDGSTSEGWWCLRWCPEVVEDGVPVLRRHPSVYVREARVALVARWWALRRLGTLLPGPVLTWPAGVVRAFEALDELEAIRG